MVASDAAGLEGSDAIQPSAVDVPSRSSLSIPVLSHLIATRFRPIEQHALGIEPLHDPVLRVWVGV